jgi:hypothetical protein
MVGLHFIGLIKSGRNSADQEAALGLVIFLFSLLICDSATEKNPSEDQLIGNLDSKFRVKNNGAISVTPSFG